MTSLYIGTTGPKGGAPLLKDAASPQNKALTGLLIPGVTPDIHAAQKLLHHWCQLPKQVVGVTTILLLKRTTMYKNTAVLSALQHEHGNRFQHHDWYRLMRMVSMPSTQMCCLVTQYVPWQDIHSNSRPSTSSSQASSWRSIPYGFLQVACTV